MRISFVIAIGAMLGLSAGCAPMGYHYDVGSLTPTPNDACQRPEVSSSGAISILNSSIGQNSGIPGRVTEITSMASADPAQLSALGIRLGSGSNSVVCHATLRLVNGQSKGGVVAFTDPGAYAPVQVEWLSDADIAAKRAAADGLRSPGKKLYVQPDLATPAIQECVGGQTALGAGEQYPGQLWAACSARAGAKM